MISEAALLSEALGVEPGHLVSFVGGGGKTQAILSLSAELVSLGRRVIVSTTTKVGGRVERAMPLLLSQGEPRLSDVSEVLDAAGRVFLAVGRAGDGKLVGHGPGTLTEIGRHGAADAVLVEADGARQLPLKAPGEREPVVPEGTDILVPMAGLDVLGRPLAAGSVHRPDRVRALAPSDVVTEAVVARVLSADAGGLKCAPPGAAVRPLLNKMDVCGTDAALRTAALILANRPDRIDRVLVAALTAGTCAVVTNHRC